MPLTHEIYGTGFMTGCTKKGKIGLQDGMHVCNCNDIQLKWVDFELPFTYLPAPEPV